MAPNKLAEKAEERRKERMEQIKPRNSVFPDENGRLHRLPEENELPKEMTKEQQDYIYENSRVQGPGEDIIGYSVTCDTGDYCRCSCTCEPYDVDELVDLLRLTVRASVDQDERDIADKFKKLVEILYE